MAEKYSWTIVAGSFYSPAEFSGFGVPGNGSDELAVPADAGELTAVPDDPAAGLTWLAFCTPKMAFGQSACPPANATTPRTSAAARSATAHGRGVPAAI